MDAFLRGLGAEPTGSGRLANPASLYDSHGLHAFARGLRRQWSLNVPIDD